MTRHIHADLIIAWANGAEIQFYDSKDERWEDCKTIIWNIETKYRIKPEPPKTVGYKRYIYQWREKYLISVVHKDTCYNVEEQDTFVKWIDTEWQYYTIE